MQNLTQAYQVLDREGFPMGEIIKGQLYDADGHREGYTLTKDGLIDDEGNLAAGWVEGGLQRSGDGTIISLRPKIS